MKRMVIMKTNNQKALQNTLLTAILSAAALVIFFIEFPLIPSSHLKMDFSDIPAIIAGVLINPLAGVVVELVKNLLEMLFKGLGTTMGFGNLMNFLVGVAFVVPFSVIIRAVKEPVKGFFLASAAAAISMLAVGFFGNYLVTPAYFEVFVGVEIDGAQALGYAVAATGFNALKSAILIGIMLPVMKFALPPLKKIVDKRGR